MQASKRQTVGLLRQLVALVLVCATQSIEADVSSMLAAPDPDEHQLLSIPEATAKLHGDDAEELFGAKLLLVQAVFRHGARTPLTDRYLMPHMQWKQCSISPKGPPLLLRSPNGTPRMPRTHQQQIFNTSGSYCAKGALTRVGYAQARSFGAWLRRRYAQHYRLISTSNSAAQSQITAHSTHVSRAVLTLAGVVEGLMPTPGSLGAGTGAVGGGGGGGSTTTSGSRGGSSKAGVGGGLLGSGSGGSGGSGGSASRQSSLLPMVVEAPPEGHHILYANALRCPRLGELVLAADHATHVRSESQRKSDRELASHVRTSLHLDSLPHIARAATRSSITAHSSKSRKYSASKHRASGSGGGSSQGQGHGSGSGSGGSSSGGAVAASSSSTSEWLSWKRLLDAVMCASAEGLPLHPGMTPALRATINREATSRIAAVLGPACDGEGPCKHLLQLGIGLLLQRLLEQMQARAAGCSRVTGGSAGPGGSGGRGSGAVTGKLPSVTCAGGSRGGPLPLQLFSGHDTTLMPIMAALGHPLSRWPPFMSALVIELWGIPTTAAATGSSTRRLSSAAASSSSSSSWGLGAAGADRDHHPGDLQHTSGRASHAGADAASEAGGGQRGLARARDSGSKQGQSQGQGRPQAQQQPAVQVQHRVRVLYNFKPLHLITPEGNTTLPLLDHVVDMMARYALTPAEYESLCRLDPPEGGDGDGEDEEEEEDADADAASGAAARPGHVMGSKGGGSGGGGGGVASDLVDAQQDDDDGDGDGGDGGDDGAVIKRRAQGGSSRSASRGGSNGRGKQ